MMRGRTMNKRMQRRVQEARLRGEALRKEVGDPDQRLRELLEESFDPNVLRMVVEEYLHDELGWMSGEQEDGDAA